MDALFKMTENYQPEFFAVFQGLFEDDAEHPDVRSALALTFGKLGSFVRKENDNPFLSLLMAYSNDPDVTVRNYIVQALGMIGREEAIPVLIDALEDDNNFVFHSAADSLGKIGEPAVPHLMELIDSGADDARCIAAWKLGELQYEGAIPKLISVIEADENPELLALCVWALGEIGYYSDNVMDVLNAAKIHEHPDVNQRAQLAIKKIARHCN